MKPERHENADMICAKANDMNLVVLAKCKASDGECWIEVEMESLSLHPDTEHFLCLPQHKEAVLNSLNGGDSELSFDGEIWTDCDCNQPPIEWDTEWWYMRPQSQSRIKPKKEKRWIIVNTRYEEVDERLFEYEPDMLDRHPDSKVIQIEVEV